MCGGAPHIGELTQGYKLAVASLKGATPDACDLSRKGDIFDICAPCEGVAAYMCDGGRECYAIDSTPTPKGVVGNGSDNIVEDDASHAILPVVEHKGGTVALGDVAGDRPIVDSCILYLVGCGDIGVLHDAELVEHRLVVAHVVENYMGYTGMVGVVGRGCEVQSVGAHRACLVEGEPLDALGEAHGILKVGIYLYHNISARTIYAKDRSLGSNKVVVLEL